jgi:hypothetical protein
MFRDSFTDTSGTALLSHTGENGATWTKHPTRPSPFAITNANRVRPTFLTALAGSFYYSSWVPASAEYDISAKFRFVGTMQTSYFVGVFFRCDTAVETGYQLSYVPSSGDWQLNKFVAGAATLLGNYVASYSNGTDVNIVVKCRNAKKQVYIDGVLRIETTDNAVTGAGRIALRGVGASTSSDTTDYHLDGLWADDKLTSPTPLLLIGETATGNVRVYGATPGHEYALWIGSDAVQATVDANGKASMTSAAAGVLREYTSSSLATPAGGGSDGLALVGNVFETNPTRLGTTDFDILATDASYYYPTSQYGGSRSQVVETASYRFICYRIGLPPTASVVVVRFNKSTGAIDQGPVTLRSAILNAHELFGLARAPDGKLRFVAGGTYSGGAAPTDAVVMRVSTSADDVSAWGAAVDISTGGGFTPQAIEGTYAIDSTGVNHMVITTGTTGGGSGGDVYYGTATNAAPTTWTWRKVVSIGAVWGGLIGDMDVDESTSPFTVRICWSSFKLSGVFGATDYRWAFYLQSQDGFATAKKADGSSAGALPRAFSDADGSVAGADQISSLYHYGYSLKIASLAGVPHVLLDNSRGTSNPMTVRHWDGSSWVAQEIAELPRWIGAAINNANWGAAMLADGSTLYVYAAVGFPIDTEAAYPGSQNGFRLMRFASNDSFASYAVAVAINDNYEPFSYTELNDGTARPAGAAGAGLCYPKVPKGYPNTILFGAVDRDYATVATVEGVTAAATPMAMMV